MIGQPLTVMILARDCAQKQGKNVEEVLKEMTRDVPLGRPAEPDEIASKAGPVLSVDVAPDEPPRQMRWLREKPVQLVPITSKVSKI